MKYEYTEKEIRLIKEFGKESLIDKIPPVTLYRVMAREAFLDNRQDVYADSVRRCLRAIEIQFPLNKKEFDNLIYGCEELDSPSKDNQ